MTEGSTTALVSWLSPPPAKLSDIGKVPTADPAAEPVEASAPATPAKSSKKRGRPKTRKDPPMPKPLTSGRLSQIAKKSVAKGRGFESQIAKMLSEWSGHKFHRCPASGALRWNSIAWTFGDLLPPEWFAFTIECKRYAKIHFESILDLRAYRDKICVSEFEDWHRQACRDAERATEKLKYQIIPMLVWRRDNGNARISVPSIFASYLQEDVVRIPSMTIYLPDSGTFAHYEIGTFLKSVTAAKMVKAREQYVSECPPELLGKW